MSDLNPEYEFAPVVMASELPALSFVAMADEGCSCNFLTDMSSIAAGWVARVGSGMFLCVQILMLLDFVVAWNDAWVDKEDERWAANPPVLRFIC